MKTINPVLLEVMLEDDATVEVLDLRPRTEFQHDHIPGSHSLPAAEASPESVMFSRQLLPTEPLYLVSDSGGEALLSAKTLERQGVDNLVVLSGGMRAWHQHHLPTVCTELGQD